MHISFTTPKKIKVKTAFDLSKESAPGCIPVMVFNNKCEPEVWYTLANLFIVSLKESSLQDYWKIFHIGNRLKNIVKWSVAKNHFPVTFHSAVNKLLEKLVNRLYDHFEKNMVSGLLN